MRRIFSCILIIVILMSCLPVVYAQHSDLLADYASAGINILYIPADELEANRDDYVGQIVCTTVYFSGKASHDNRINAAISPDKSYEFDATFQNPDEYSSLTEDEAFTVIGLSTPGSAMDFGDVHLYDSHILATGDESIYIDSKISEPTALTIANSSSPDIEALLKNYSFDVSEIIGVDALTLKDNRDDYVGSVVYTTVFFDDADDEAIKAKITPDGIFCYDATFSDPSEFASLVEDDIIVIAGTVGPGTFLDFGDVHLQDCHIIAQGIDAEAIMAQLTGGTHDGYRTTDIALIMDNPSSVKSDAIPTPTATLAPTSSPDSSSADDDNTGLLGGLFDFSLDIEEFEFELNEDGVSYSLIDYNYLSKQASETAVIPSTYNNLPVTKIHSQAFYACDQIESVVIPEGVWKIGSYAFYHCTNLKNVVIPESVQAIEEYAFEGCDALESINTPQAIDIGFRAFCECAGLKSIVIGNGNDGIVIGASSIGEYAFNECTNLENVTLGKSITYIGGNAFSHCENLSTISITSSVCKIGDSAFEYCRNLETIYFDGTSSEWGSIDKWSWWDKDTGNYEVKYLEYADDAPTPTPETTVNTKSVILKRGDKGEDVRQLQLRLIALGFLAGSADGDFGGKTEAALIAYQTAAGLDATGVYDAQTAASIHADDAPTPTPEPTVDPKSVVLKRGDKSEDVRQLQLRLIALGYLTGSADGDFGAKTEAALIAYQDMAGLPETGECDYNTFQSITSSSAPVAPTAAPTPKPTAKPSYDDDGYSGGTTYIGNKNTKKFHYSWCSSVDDMKDKNKVSLSSREAAISKGYVPCKRCDP